MVVSRNSIPVVPSNHDPWIMARSSTVWIGTRDRNGHQFLRNVQTQIASARKIDPRGTSASKQAGESESQAVTYAS
jgi:hypothetical protein